MRIYEKMTFDHAQFPKFRKACLVTSDPDVFLTKNDFVADINSFMLQILQRKIYKVYNLQFKIYCDPDYKRNQVQVLE